MLRFVGKLRRLKPEVSLDQAEQAAIGTLQSAGLMDPEDAAAIYGAEPPPDAVGAPGD